MTNSETPQSTFASTPPAGGRILAPDLARGMMLLFIAIANVSVYLWGRETAGVSAHPRGEGPLDTALSTLAIVFVDGHVYPMFAFLFGYGITQFAMSRIGRGVPAASVSRMLLRRYLWLLAFGAVHALLLFAGDILGAYALTGLAIFALLLRGSDRVMRVLLWVLGGLVLGSMLLGALALLAIGLVLPEEVLLQLPGADAALPGSAQLMSGIANYWAAMLARIGIWSGSTVGTVLGLIVPLAALLGGYAARYRWLEGTSTRIPLRPVAMWGIAVSVLGSLPAALDFLGIWQSGMPTSLAWTLLAQLCGIAGGLGYAALFALIGLRPAAASNGAAKAIAAVGKRSLSFYLLQSLVFAPLLSAWGFGLGAVLGTSSAYLLALSVWLVSLALAAWLEHRGAKGPAEALLRSLSRS